MDVTGPSGVDLDGPDDRDLDDGGLDLTPRTDRVPSHRGPRRHWGAVAFLVILVLVAGFIVTKALGSATLFYKNADEAVRDKASLGTKTFRIQGVVNDKPRDAGNAVDFQIAYHGVAVKVRHTGSEPALFKAGLPIVAEGHWNAAGTEFDSVQILVKHTEDYEKVKDPNYAKEHPDRVEPK
ncbi:MAG TPA: cytochrome c maturation protein CcmE [Acidimicrobiales bacterium]|jgi:cytochrome c-type biogenesis protein CcmE